MRDAARSRQAPAVRIQMTCVNTTLSDSTEVVVFFDDLVCFRAICARAPP